MCPERRFVERIDAQAQVVEVACILARGRAATPAEFSIHRDDVDHRCARAQVAQAEVVAPARDFAAQYLSIEGFGTVEVAHAQHQVVEALHCERRRRSGHGSGRLADDAVGDIGGQRLGRTLGRRAITAAAAGFGDEAVARAERELFDLRHRLEFDQIPVEDRDRARARINGLSMQIGAMTREAGINDRPRLLHAVGGLRTIAEALPTLEHGNADPHDAA